GLEERPAFVGLGERPRVEPVRPAREPPIAREVVDAHAREARESHVLALAAHARHRAAHERVHAHDAPLERDARAEERKDDEQRAFREREVDDALGLRTEVVVGALDGKSTRLNSSHVKISYALSCWATTRKDRAKS